MGGAASIPAALRQDSAIGGADRSRSACGDAVAHRLEQPAGVELVDEVGHPPAGGRALEDQPGAFLVAVILEPDRDLGSVLARRR